MDVINQDKREIFNNHYGFLEGYEDLYNRETNKFDITGLDKDSKEIIDKIKKTGIYDVAKVFYTTEGSVEEYGFGVIIQPWAFQMLKPAYDDTISKSNPDDFSEYEPFYAPRIFFDEWTPIKVLTKTHLVYPNVYVNSLKDVYRLEGENTWKTNVLIPVELVDGEDDISS